MNRSPATQDGYGAAELTFQPRLESRSRNLKRNEDVQEILYRDALRRQTKSVENLRKRQAPQQKKFMNENSKRLLAHKLIKEFEQESEKYFGEFQEHRFNYLQMSEFLKLLRFVSTCEDVNNPYFIHERTLLYDMWVLLKGDKFKGINERNLLVMLLAVLGLNFPIPPYMQPDAVEQNGDENEAESGTKQRYYDVPEENSVEAHSTPSSHNRFNKEEPCTSAKKSENSDIPIQKTANFKLYSEDISLNNSSDFTKSPNRNLDDSTKVDLANLTQSKLALHANQNNNDNSFDIGQQVFSNSSHIQNTSCSNIGNSKRKSIGTSPLQKHEAIVENILGECSDAVNHRINFGSFDSRENVSFTDEEVECINHVYEVFYMNRLHSTIKAPEEVEAGSRIPDISDNSRRLAEAYREKQLEEAANFLVQTQQSPPNNGRLTHADLLMCNKSAQKMKLVQKAQEYAEKELETCTFTPSISDNKRCGSATPYTASHNNQSGILERDLNVSQIRSSKRSSTPSGYAGMRRTEDLHALGKQNYNKEDKSYVDWYDEKFAKECTFKPVISRSHKYDSRKRSVESISNANKSIERIKKGREQREQQMLLQSRGTPVNGIPFDRAGSFNCGIDRLNNQKIGLDKLSTRERPAKSSANTTMNYNQDNTWSRKTSVACARSKTPQNYDSSFANAYGSPPEHQNCK